MKTSDRFSDRVQAYIKYRPRYPRAAIDHLVKIAGLGAQSTVVDVGSGTGFSAEPFLELGCTVHGVEPNAAMRAAAEELLSRFDRFHSIDGTSESTKLPNDAADLVLSAQAFHWFDRARSKPELNRICKPDGALALMWNARLTNTPFLQQYDELLQLYGTDYNQVNHENIGEQEIADFLGSDFQLAVFSNEQRFTLDGLRGRLLSSSYVPVEGQPGHRELFAGVERLFFEHQKDNHVTLQYDTRVYTAKPRRP